MHNIFVYCLAEYCEFGTLGYDLIGDRIVVGIKDKKLWSFRESNYKNQAVGDS